MKEFFCDFRLLLKQTEQLFLPCITRDFLFDRFALQPQFDAQDAVLDFYIVTCFQLVGLVIDLERTALVCDRPRMLIRPAPLFFIFLIFAKRNRLIAAYGKRLSEIIQPQHAFARALTIDVLR